MEYNKLIASQKLAGKLLLKDNKAALAIKNNPPQLYIIEDLLFANIPTLKTFPVWAVKTGTDYTGIVVYSGIAEEGKIVNAIRLKFSDVNIIHVVEADEFVTPYVQARIENGRWELKRLLQLSDSVEAQNALYDQYPELKGKEAVLIRVKKHLGKKYNCFAFWAIWGGTEYKAVNPYSGTYRVFSPYDVAAEMTPGERFDGHYRLIKKNGKPPRFILWRIKKEVSF